VLAAGVVGESITRRREAEILESRGNGRRERVVTGAAGTAIGVALYDLRCRVVRALIVEGVRSERRAKRRRAFREREREHHEREQRKHDRGARRAVARLRPVTA
jgi:hypothetical protein